MKLFCKTKSAESLTNLVGDLGEDKHEANVCCGNAGLDPVVVLAGLEAPSTKSQEAE